MTNAKAYARVGLLGNPSDIYGGKCISFTFDKFAKVEINDSDRLSISGCHSLQKLILATLRYLNITKEKIKISITCETNIPESVGLGGSSAVIIATIRALNHHFSLNMNEYEIAEAALHVETDELKMVAGPQDRYAISFGGVVYMDFSGKEFLRRDDPYGKVRKISIRSIPCFLCLSKKTDFTKSSTKIHESVREEFLRGGERAEYIKKQMDLVAGLSEKGEEFLMKNNWSKLGDLMISNSKIRNRLFPKSEEDTEIINDAIKFGAWGAKLAGSGGAVVVLGNQKVYSKMIKKYECIRIKITGS